jgi:triosephosphate isomerase (TIM)
MSHKSPHKKLIIANWKMHFDTHQASLFVHKLASKVAVHKNVEVVLAPTLLALQSLSIQIDHKQFKLAAQNCYWQDEGAYTGEVSATMLRGLVKYVLVGHSERRHIFHESNQDTAHKVQAVLRNGMLPVLCVGETAREHADGELAHVIHDQVTAGLRNVTSEEVVNVVIAYEPLWAISNGKNFEHHAVPTPSDMEKAVKNIRKQVSALYGEVAGTNMRILYGGSADRENASGFLNVTGVDGLLIGGASLNAETFASIVEVAHNKT